MEGIGTKCIHGVYMNDPCRACNEDECGKPSTPPPDFVNKPPHYTQGDIECWDAIEAALTTDEWRGYIKGTLLQYIWRERFKGGDEDMAKVGAYLKRGGWLK